MLEREDKSKKPLISVLILTYNQAQFIEAALLSVVSQISSSYDLEILLTDDGSDDGTVDIIKSFSERSPVGITFFENKHQGVTAIAQNFLSMINIASGDFVAFLAGDDSYVEGRFEAQLKSFLENPSLQIIYTDGVNRIDGKFGEHCHPVPVIDLMESGDSKKVYNYLTTEAPILFIQGVLARLDFLRATQPFDTDLIADDWVFNIKIFDALVAGEGGFKFEHITSFVRNIHDDNTSRNLPVHYERVSQVADRYCKNPRAIKAKFIGNATFSALKGKNKKDTKIFLKKMMAYPEAIFWFSKIALLNTLSYVKRRIIHRNVL
jgi:glycosyltransferase involved in cell wall biosynthesis